MEAAQTFASLHPSLVGKDTLASSPGIGPQSPQDSVSPCRGCRSITMVPFTKPMLQPRAGATEGKLRAREQAASNTLKPNLLFFSAITQTAGLPLENKLGFIIIRIWKSLMVTPIRLF